MAAGSTEETSHFHCYLCINVLVGCCYCKYGEGLAVVNVIAAFEGNIGVRKTELILGGCELMQVGRNAATDCCSTKYSSLNTFSFVVLKYCNYMKVSEVNEWA